MTNYESPVILRTEELAEGVYLASGCYTASAYIHQTPQSGSGEYRIQVNGQHSADHTKEAQTLTISFSLPVTYTSSGGSLVSGSGTNTLVINYNYHQNPTDNDRTEGIWLCRQMRACGDKREHYRLRSRQATGRM